MKTLAWATYRGRPVPQKDYRETWLFWLRSGLYKQGKNWLKDDDRFCCLGVAADILGTEWEGGFSKVDGNKVCLNTPRAVLFNIKDQGIVQRMNDTGSTFDEIADWLSEQ